MNWHWERRISESKIRRRLSWPHIVAGLTDAAVSMSCDGAKGWQTVQFTLPADQKPQRKLRPIFGHYIYKNGPDETGRQ
jgi:hypothetical protein